LLRGEFDDGLPDAGPMRQGKSAGALLALLQIARRLGIPGALGKGRKSLLALLLLFARLLVQGSRLRAVRWASEHAVEEVLGVAKVNEDQLYETLDWLCENQEAIERRLYRKRFAQAPPKLFLYDVTSSYLEGDQNELANYGYNRDGKKGKKQIVIGLLADANGDPVAVRVFEGNTGDTRTVEEQIRTLSQSFGVEETVLVGDRGMLKGPQIESLPEGFRYITAITKPQIRTLLEAGTIQMDLFGEVLAEVESDGIRYILKRNPVRREEVGRSRQGKLDKVRTLLGREQVYLDGHPRARPEVAAKRLRARVNRLKIGSFVEVACSDRTLSLSVNQEAREEVALLDGCYVIKTDLPRDAMDAEGVHGRYRDLAHVERDFRTLKTTFLETRPLFVRKASRTRGAVFVAMLALLLQRHMEAALDAGWAASEEDPERPPVREALLSLDRLCIQHQEVEGLPLARIPLPDDHQKKILEAIDVTLPVLLLGPRM
jgi:hypothetical protein